MPITQRVSLFGYNAAEAEKLVNRIEADFKKTQLELESKLEEIKLEIEELRKQIEYYKKNRTIVVKKRIVRNEKAAGKSQKEIMNRLFETHLNTTEKLMKIQSNIADVIERKKSAIIIREKKLVEMQEDLDKLVSYVKSMASDYR